LLKISPWLAGLITGESGAYRYLGQSIGEFPNRSALTDELRAAGFTEVFATAMTCGIVALHEARK
jgi:demethylmenaquinone methyltransferase/2-methoxy-6-polyprenyl-1,4-benzoquinol methylase